MADVITGNTQLAPTKNDLIIALVQKELKFAAKLLPYVTNLSPFVGKGMKSVSVPKLSSFTVQNRASAVAGDIQTLTSLKDTLDLDLNHYVSWLIDSSDEAQTSIDAQMEFLKRAGAAMGRKVDEELIAGIEAAAGLNVGAAPITRDLILDAREELFKNQADMSQVVMVVGPDSEKAMLKLDEFTRAEVYGSAVIPAGMIGKVYGMPVIVHTGMSAGKALWWEVAGYAAAFQIQPSIAEQPEIAYGTKAKRVAMDQLWGHAGLQLGELGKGATQSPLIVKMA